MKIEIGFTKDVRFIVFGFGIDLEESSLVIGLLYWNIEIKFKK